MRVSPSLDCHPILKGHFLRVAAAFFAEREREAAERLAAALRACRDSAFLDAALCPSRLSAREVARERFAYFFPSLAFTSAPSSSNVFTVSVCPSSAARI